nr:protein TIC110, chloroplastic [Tanacetum cinerariifolium]
MNPSLFTTQQPPPSPKLVTPFLNPTLKPSPNSITFHNRCVRYMRRHTSVVLSSATPKAISDVFGGKQELTSLGASVMVVASALAAGYGLGLKLGGNKNVIVGEAVALGVIGVGAAYVVNSSVSKIAAVSLQNYVSGSNPGVSKDLWERVQLLMQGTSLTKQERECKLYDAFD